MKYIITLNGKQFAVEAEHGKATAQYMGPAAPTPAAPAPAAPAAPAATVPAPAAAPAAPAGAGEPVKAPMPGNILDVRVSAEQTVKAGDILFILEAMKMENEIVAPKDGALTSVCVSKGQVVETGAVLCTLA